MRTRLAALGLGLCCAALCEAHEGERHQDLAPAAAVPAAVVVERAQRLPDGSLYLPKAIQRLLGIRTGLWPAAAAPATLTLLAEVQPQPAAAVTIAAPGPGALEAADRAWPLPGQAVQAGEVLARLRPQLSQRDAAQRRARMAELDQKLIIADINVERLGLQSAVNGEQKVASGNIYYEQAVAERDALRRERELVAQSLQDRVPLRARVSGRVLSAPLRPGDVVGSGQVLFELTDPAQLRLAALSFDPALGGRVRSAVVQPPQAGALPLDYRGQEPLPAGPGWRLLFEPRTAAPDLSPGRLVEVRLDLSSERPLLPQAACVANADGSVTIWLHRAPERFVALKLASCAQAAELASGERLVVAGGALLSQYR